jgi:hypothetical protein
MLNRCILCPGNILGRGIDMAAHDRVLRLWPRIVVLTAAILSIALVMAIIYAV